MQHVIHRAGPAGSRQTAWKSGGQYHSQLIIGEIGVNDKTVERLRVERTCVAGPVGRG